MTDEEALDDAKVRYQQAKADIERLRDQITNKQCPLRVGDRVTVVNGDKTFDGIIEVVAAAPSIEDLLFPTPGVHAPWAAAGKRIKKSTGQLGSWGFSIPAEAELKEGKWHLPQRTIEDAFGLPPTP